MADLLSSPDGTQLYFIGGDLVEFDTGVPVVLPKVSVATASATEGTAASVPIRLDVPSTLDVLVTYTMADGSAISGTDYEATTGTITIPAGDTEALVAVTTTLRTGYQPARSFTVTISNARTTTPTSLTITVAAASVQIFDTEVPTGSHGYFEAMTATTECILAESLRNQADLDRLRAASGPSTKITYDPGGDTHPEAQDAAKMLLPGDGVTNTKLGGDNQLYFNPPGGIEAGSLIISWDWYWPEELVGPSVRGSGSNHYDAVKAWQVMNNGKRFWTLMQVFNVAQNQNVGEPQAVSCAWDELDMGVKPTGMIRHEAVVPTGTGTKTGRYGFTDYEQYTRSRRKHKMYASKWTRYWIEFRLHQPASSFTDWNAEYGVTVLPNPDNDDGTWIMVSFWMADEDYGPQRLLYKVPFNHHPERGDPQRITRFRFEFDVSNSIAVGNIVGYGRNVFMLHNYTLPAVPETDTFLFQRPE